MPTPNNKLIMTIIIFYLFKQINCFWRTRSERDPRSVWGAGRGLAVQYSPACPRIDVLLADGAGGLISASRGHSYYSCHLLPKAAWGTTIQHQTHFKYLFRQPPRTTYLDVECRTLPGLKEGSCDPVDNISAHLTERSMVDNTSIATKSALVSVQALFLLDY